MEFAHDIGVEARRNGLINIFVSNGFDTPDTVAMMDDFLDCITVDFKGSGETNFVRKYIGIPDAQPIFQTIQEIRDRGKTHIEIKRYGFDITGWNLDEKNRCTNCSYQLPIFGNLSSSVSEDRFLPVVN